MNTTLLPQQQEKISKIVNNMNLCVGKGTAESACSIAAINLALTGNLTDVIPDCMSAVIGKWIIGVQDAMPAEIRNSPEWKSLLPFAAGTGRDRESERLKIILDWIWDDVLPLVQPVANENGFGKEWEKMLTAKTLNAAADAALAADTVFDSFNYITNSAAHAARDVAAASVSAAMASNSSAAARAVCRAAAYSSYAVAHAAARAVVCDDFWERVSPLALLEKLIRGK